MGLDLVATSRRALAAAIGVALLMPAAASASPVAVAHTVDYVYYSAFGRFADASGKAYWENRVNANCAAQYPTMIRHFVRGSEFLATHPGARSPRTATVAQRRDAVYRVYATALWRGGDTEGIEYWQSRLGSGSLTWVQFTQSLTSLSEFAAKRAAVCRSATGNRAPGAPTLRETLHPNDPNRLVVWPYYGFADPEGDPTRIMYRCEYADGTQGLFTSWAGAIGGWRRLPENFMMMSCGRGDGQAWRLHAYVEDVHGARSADRWSTWTTP